jgi:ABC-type dipeptide/oligopeptide/nickel transport system permease component
MTTPATQSRFNTLAILAIVAAYPLPVVGIVLGIIARRQLCTRGERGAGLALVAIIVGILFFIANVVVLIMLASYVIQLANICGGSSVGCG